MPNHRLKLTDVQKLEHARVGERLADRKTPYRLTQELAGGEDT
jgi:hypothetical protein